MYKYILTVALLSLLATGCHRPENITVVYNVPTLDNEQKAAVLQNALNSKLSKEIKQINIDTQLHTVTASFNEKLCRTMNVEQVIAEAGFAVNHRPSYGKKK